MFILLKNLFSFLNLKKYEDVFKLLSLFVFISVLFGFYMFYVENLSFVDTYYYLITTATTVGYGDFSPTTSFGKVVSTFYMVTSISIFGLIIGDLGETVLNNISKRKKGLKQIKNKIDLLIIGYPFEEKIKELVQELRKDPSFYEKRIGLISNQIEEKPEWFLDYDIEFIKGLGSNPDILNKANIQYAEIALILAIEPDKIESDDFTSSAITVVKKLNPEIRVIAEKVRQDNILFSSTGCDTITRVANAYLLSQEILDPGAVELEQVIFSNEIEGTQFNMVYNGPDITWLDLVIQMTKKETILEGYKKGQNFNFLPSPNDIICKGDIVKYRAKERVS